MRLTAVLVAGFSFMIVFYDYVSGEAIFPSACVNNPVSPAASIAFLANCRFDPASLPVGRQK